MRWDALQRAINAWCAAAEARRARAAAAAGLTPLYKARAAGEAATAGTWYAFGALTLDEARGVQGEMEVANAEAESAAEERLAKLQGGTA